ncbi:MAG: hypothetical protein ACI9N9_000101 [Enterobacterales bacterium]|jgi:hypothetical protein
MSRAHEAHKIEVVVARLPQSNIEEDRGLDECCLIMDALASQTSTESKKNDVYLAPHKRASLAETVTFVIKKCDSNVVLPNYGNVRVCPQDPLAVVFEYDWREYLINETAGVYVISKQFILLGASFDIEIARVRVWDYTEEHARDTVRIKSKFNALSKVGENTIDFTNSGAVDTLRMSGKFHKWNPKPTNRVLLGKDRKRIKVKGELDNEYTLNIDPLRYAFIDRLVNLHLLNNNLMWITDHNAVNPRYNYQEIPVSFITESYEPEELGRLTSSEMKFSDRVDDWRSLHNKPA